MKKAFTLAEIMVVLTVIGILCAILLPVAFNAAPDEDVMKFKKGNATLGNIIRELVNSDKYYLDGDLGVRPDGTLINGSHDGDITYFCKSFADLISTKSVNCSENEICKSYYCWQDNVMTHLELAKQYADEACLNSESIVGAEIVAANGIIYYQASPVFMFGITAKEANASFAASDDTVSVNDSASEENRIALYTDTNGFIRIYKTLCMDIDGINNGEDPFGYMLRYDGRILSGARADEWIEKSIQNND